MVADAEGRTYVDPLKWDGTYPVMRHGFPNLTDEVFVNATAYDALLGKHEALQEALARIQRVAEIVQAGGASQASVGRIWQLANDALREDG